MDPHGSEQNRLPISPDGWGVGEVAAIGLYSLVGVPAEEAFALAFLSHILQTLVVLPGLWFFLNLGSDKKDVASFIPQPSMTSSIPGE